MGIYSSSSPNDMKYWLIDELKTEATVQLEILNLMLKSKSITDEERRRFIELFYRYLSSLTKLFDFAYETRCWTESVSKFIIENGTDGLNAYLKLLSLNEPATPENLENMLHEIKSASIKCFDFKLESGFFIIRREFNDIILERYDSAGNYVASTVINPGCDEKFEKKGGIQTILETLRIEPPKDKEKTTKLLSLAQRYIIGKIKWGTFIKEIQTF